MVIRVIVLDVHHVLVFISHARSSDSRVATIVIRVRTRAAFVLRASAQVCRVPLSAAIVPVTTIIRRVVTSRVAIVLVPSMVSRAAIVLAITSRVRESRAAIVLAITSRPTASRVAISLVRVVTSLARVAISSVAATVSSVRVATVSSVRVATVSSAAAMVSNVADGYRQHTPGYNPNAKYSLKKRIEYKEENYDPNEPIRLNKFLANAGVCSRREADEFIQAGVVTVNGEIVNELGAKVMRTDEVRFHDEPVTLEKKVYVLLNKPKDYVTTSEDPQNRKTVMDLVKDACRERIYPVGRLDRNTTGVLLLTNDGDLATKLTHPQFLKKKIYHVYLNKALTAADMRLIADGITLEDGDIKADAIEYASETDKKQVGIEIHSGRNRIVRRIFESLGYHVIKLDRVYFAGLTKKNVRRGDWRFLTEAEVNMLRRGSFE